MKGGYIYTIVFMLVISILLTAALALTNSYFRPMIDNNAVLAEKKALLDAFGLDTSGTNREISDRFASQIKTVSANGLTLYETIAGSPVQGLAVPFSGPGLWGTIRGYLAVSLDMKTVLGIVFTEQNETPGLGGRIDEPAYKEQFRGLVLDPAKPVVYGQDGATRLDAVAGATSTSHAVLQILNRVKDEVLPALEVAP